MLIPQEGFRTEELNVFTEKIKRNVLSANDNIRLQTFDEVTWYPHWRGAGSVRKQNW